MIREHRPAALIFDGAYFTQSAAKCSAKHKIPFFKNYDTFKNLLELLSELCDVDFAQKYWFTAEHPHSKHEDFSFYEMLGHHNFMVDIREFKKMQCFCPNRRCEYNSKPIYRPVQAEVDVALAVKLVELALDPDIDQIVVIAGDRDFRDAYQFVGKRKDLHLFCFERTVSKSLREVVKNIFPLDDLWEPLKALSMKKPEPEPKKGGFIMY